MQYNCVIVNSDEEEVTIKVNDICITGFVNSGITRKNGETAMVDIQLYDDLEITESEESEVCIIRKGNTFAYSLYGELDIANSILKSEIDFEIDSEELLDYGYLDGKNVKIDAIRIDFDII